MDIQDAVDLSRKKQLDISLLARSDISRMAQQEAVAAGEDRVIHSLGQCRKDGVGGVGDDQTDGARSLQAETLGDPGRAVTQGLDRPEHSVPRGLGHRAGAAIHHIADRGDGDARALRDLGSSDSPLGRTRGPQLIYSYCLLVLRLTA